jgi:hypothetical protein
MNRNRSLIITLLCLGALAFACSPRSRSAAPKLLAAARHPLGPSPILSRARRHDSAVAKKTTKLDSRFNVNIAPRAVHFALQVENVGGSHIELKFPSGQSYDFIVVDSVGREVWRWSNGRMFTQGMQNKQLGVGEDMQVSETWDKPASGKYTAIATLNSTNFPVQQRVDFVMH